MIYYFIIYLITYKLQDNWKYLKRYKYIFYAIIKKRDSSLILNISALIEKDVKFDIITRISNFDINL